MNTPKIVSCHWFRKDLRLHDNAALCQALQGATTFYGIYVLSPLFDTPTVSDSKKNFLLQSLKDLDESLQKCGSKLLVLQGQLPQVFSLLFQKLGITTLTFQAAVDRYGKQNERVVTYLAEKAGVRVVTSASHSLYDFDVLANECQDKIPIVFDQFIDMVSELDPPDRPLPDITWVPKQRNTIDELLSTLLRDLDSLKTNVTNMKMVGGERSALQKLKEFVQEVFKTQTSLSNIESASCHPVKRLFPQTTPSTTWLILLIGRHARNSLLLFAFDREYKMDLNQLPCRMSR